MMLGSSGLTKRWRLTKPPLVVATSSRSSTFGKISLTVGKSAGRLVPQHFLVGIGHIIVGDSNGLDDRRGLLKRRSDNRPKRSGR